MPSLDDIWKQTQKRPSLDELAGARPEKKIKQQLDKYGSGVPKENAPWMDAMKTALKAVYSGGKDLATGLAKGGAQFGTMEQAGREQALGITPEGRELAPWQRAGAGEKALDEALPQPEGAAGRVIQAGGKALGNPSNWLMASGPIRAVTSGIGGQLGAETGIPGASLVGGAIGGGPRWSSPGAQLGANVGQHVGRGIGMATHVGPRIGGALGQVGGAVVGGVGGGAIKNPAGATVGAQAAATPQPGAGDTDLAVSDKDIVSMLKRAFESQESLKQKPVKPVPVTSWKEKDWGAMQKQ